MRRVLYNGIVVSFCFCFFFLFILVAVEAHAERDKGRKVQNLHESKRIEVG